MASFAEINSENIVIRVLSVPDQEENNGQIYLVETLGLGGTWIQTSYNAKIRGNYAGIGYSYLKDSDIFMPPKCHSEATLNVTQAKWNCTNSSHNTEPLA